MVTAQDQQTQQGTAHPDQGGAVVFPLHWSKAMTTNRAVITNSMPVVLKWIKYPSRAPRVAPATQ